MLNPFDWRGPEFLAFYVALGAIVLISVLVLRHQGEPAGPISAPLTDYLKIAYLRGGAEEALRVATLALIDRGLITVIDGDHVEASADRMPAGLQRTEQRVLEKCKSSTRASEVLDDPTLQATARVECEGQLARAGLLPDDDLKAWRQWLTMAAWVVLGVVAVVKIMIAFGRGRTNVGFLVVAFLIFGFAVRGLANPFRTAAGEAMLQDLRTLFQGLRDRAISITSPGGGNDLALLAAVFGAGALIGGHAYVSKLFRKPAHSGGSSCGSGGSSCGSGGSCGSSCGGGCGGGCGGCGS